MAIPTPQLPDLDQLALLVVDVQRGFDDAAYRGPATTRYVSRSAPHVLGLSGVILA